MKHDSPRPLIGSLLAVVVPATVLHFIQNESRLGASLTVPPFTLPLLLIAHLTLALPLGWLLAHLQQSSSLNRRFTWVLLAMVPILLVYLLGGEITSLLGLFPFAGLTLLFSRSALAIALVAPWCLAFAPDQSSTASRPRFGLMLTACLALAVVPCGLYADNVVQSRSTMAEELLSGERLAKAEPVLQSLIELGGQKPINGRSPRQLAEQLREELPVLRRLAERPLEPSLEARFDRALLLVQLDRLDEAEELLHSIASNQPLVTLVLARVQRDRERWDASNSAYRAALEHLLHASPNQAVEHCVTAYDGLVFNARERGTPREAEPILREAAERLPAVRSYFLFQLGRHYLDSGRPHAALEAFTEAAKLDPALEAKNQPYLQTISWSTPSCFVAPRWGR